MRNIALRVAGSIFLLIAIGHVLRLIFKATIMLNDMVIPLWISGIAVVVMLSLAIFMFRAARSQ